MLYCKPFGCIPPPIKWDIENELKANQEYLRYSMERQDLLHKSAVSSFIQQWGGLGLPQMPLVLIQTWICHRVLLSSNSPIQKDLTSQEACKDPSFGSFHDSDGLHLKKSHPYYHQVQIQLFVEIDLYDWCDFCIYTPKGIDVDRISLDIE